MKRKHIVLSLVALLMVCAISLMACSQQSNSSSQEYVDEKAVGIIAKGFELRSDYVEKNSSRSSDAYREAVQIEIDNDVILKDAKFKDSKLQEAVLAYLNSLDDQMSALKNTKFQSEEFYRAWDEAYDNRTKALKALVDNYGLTVQDKYKDTLTELTDNGNAVSIKEASDKALQGLLDSANWEKTDLGFGHYQYTAVIENSSDYDFKNVSIIVNLFDGDGVKTETYANANSWKKGEKVRFEAFGNEVDAERVEAEVQHYQV